jgi:hypothetical protein
LREEALVSSETSVLKRATWRKIPEDTILQQQQKKSCFGRSSILHNLPGCFSLLCHSLYTTRCTPTIIIISSSITTRDWCNGPMVARAPNEPSCTLLSEIHKIRSYVRFEDFTAVTEKNAVFWDVTPCGSCKKGGFGGTCRLHD